MLACASSALAAGAYRYDAALSGKLSEELPGGSFGEPWSVAFDAGGNLFVADPGHEGGGVIDKFDAGDALLAQLGGTVLNPQYTRGVAVNDESGHIYVADSTASEIVVLSATGEKLSQWTGANTPAPEGFGKGCCYVQVAVDNSASSAKGDVYVMSTQNGGEVFVLEAQGEDKEEGKYLRNLEVPPEGFGFDSGGHSDLAVDDSSGPGAGDVYVANTVNKVIDRFSPAGSFEEAIKGPSSGQPFSEPLAVAVAGTTGDLFVIDHQPSGYVIDELDPSGALLAQIKETNPGEGFGEPLGIAIQRSGEGEGNVYVSDAGKKVVDVFAPAVASSPEVVSSSVSEVSADAANLIAEINPEGNETEYRFQYGPCTTPATCAENPYPSTTAAFSLGAEDFEAHSTLPIHIQGLTAGTTYHFRAIATNSQGQLTGEERTFTTQGAGGGLVLPDARQWELVSPVEKLGSLIAPIEEVGVVQAAASGDGITYRANAPTEAQPQGLVGGVQMLSLRTAAGWSTQNLAVPHSEAPGKPVGLGTEFRFFTEDLASAFVQPFGGFDPSISPEATEQNAFLRSDYLNGNRGEPCLPASMDCYRPLVTGKAGIANVPAGTVFGQVSAEGGGTCPVPAPVCGPEFLGASADGKHVVLRSPVALSEGEAPARSLYEWSGDEPPAQQLKLVSVLPNGQPAEAARLSNPGDHNARGAISPDGAQVVFEGGLFEKALYLRDTEHGRTIELDEAEGKCLAEGQCESGNGQYQLASSDGSEVLFSDERRLTADAGKAGTADLYRCEIVKGASGPECRLTDLTPESGGKSAEVQGSVIGASEDGEWIYFVANGVLAGNADSDGEHAVGGRCEPSPPPDVQCNLYVRHGSQTRLVAVLSGEDLHDWARELSQMPARVSPNGQWLEFMSQRDLSGYDNRDVHTGEPDAEVYLYSAAKDRVLCASCEPSGARPVGVEYAKLEPNSGGLVGGPRETWVGSAPVAASVPGWTGNANAGAVVRHQPRYLTNEGRLFFNSADGLVPQDVNNTQDVYQYEPEGIAEPPGVPGCTSSSATFSSSSSGCVDLISSGESAQESAFLDASESGSDVFFLTSQQLSKADSDEARDVYDAHQCTAGSPCTAPGAEHPPACDTGDSCKPASTPQPEVFGTPASALFSGPGNLSPPAAVKPKIPTRAERLANALQSCRKRYAHARKRRVGCERKARRQFGAKHKQSNHKKKKAKQASGKSAKSNGRGR